MRENSSDDDDDDDDDDLALLIRKFKKFIKKNKTKCKNKKINKNKFKKDQIICYEFKKLGTSKVNVPK